MMSCAHSVTVMTVLSCQQVQVTLSQQLNSAHNWLLQEVNMVKQKLRDKMDHFMLGKKPAVDMNQRVNV